MCSCTRHRSSSQSDSIYSHTHLFLHSLWSWSYRKQHRKANRWVQWPLLFKNFVVTSSISLDSLPLTHCCVNQALPPPLPLPCNIIILLVCLLKIRWNIIKVSIDNHAMYHCLQLYYLTHIFIIAILPYFHYVTLPIPHLLQAVDITAGRKASVTFISILCFCAVANARCRWSLSVSLVHLERNTEDRRMLQ